MGCRNGGFISEEEKAISETLSDVLLFTTMCIIGLPVDVHVKDGSIYSGTFYTACLDDDYAIVLKKARMTQKGNRDANVPNGCLIETLIIQAQDLVQVVAKDILLPAEGIPRKGGADDDCALAAVTPQDLCKGTGENATKPDESSTKHNCRNSTSLPSLPVERLSVGSPDANQRDFSAEPKIQVGEEIDEVQATRSSVDACDSLPDQLKSNNEEAEEYKFPNPSFEKSYAMNTKDPKHERLSFDRSENPGALSSDASAPASKFCPTLSSTVTTLMAPKPVKEFNLNPKAKVFCPSTVLQRPATPPALATLANMTYVPDLLPMAPTASPEQEIDTSSFPYRSSTPAKYLPQNNLVYGSGHGDQQYSQHVQYVGSRTQPVRYAAHYGHLQPGTVMHPNSHNVMPGRWGPVVYVHPASNDVVTHSSGRLSQVPAHAILTPHSVNIPKHQATASMQTMQVYMTPPFMANGMQPLTMPSYIPMSQTLGQVLPVMGAFPGSDNSFVTKFV